MRSLRAFGAREPRAAAQHAAALLAVSAVILLVLPVFYESDGGTPALVVHWIGVATLVGAAATCALLDPAVLDRWHMGLVLGLGSVVLIGALNLLTSDVSAGSQAFYAFPVLWSAVHLRRPAVVLVTASALAADLMTLLVLLPTPAALADFLFFGALLVAIAALLVRANRTQERLVAALQRQLTVDSLTGLATRRAFDDALELALDRPVPGGTALVLIDVDSFKAINDTHGHPVGDDVLVHLARVLRGRIRSDDAVLSRLGGDELAVLLPGCAREVAARRAEELLEAVRAEPLALPDGSLVALSISLGVAHLPRHSRDRRGLYTSADSALYEAKRGGRGRVALAAV
ncbi:diguanylate cyclase (GGDEF) domain-containing protein [Blastococcus sp. DSM 46786]|uniref:GGDEF domain-containing protein n=1 Tax=Blastococcus sp. DSM 46786 TaxID=1798227 RepID=UPI0008D41B1F|nr:GGDEF domain-containing protein [Blastococcus sp. DSM 46786]SEM02399.1 diguanylate cyclase (GGDEF) domain-containing protein [Blastococcus sp. DSM 46786]